MRKSKSLYQKVVQNFNLVANDSSGSSSSFEFQTNFPFSSYFKNQLNLLLRDFKLFFGRYLFRGGLRERWVDLSVALSPSCGVAAPFLQSVRAPVVRLCPHNAHSFGPALQLTPCAVFTRMRLVCLRVLSPYPELLAETCWSCESK